MLPLLGFGFESCYSCNCPELGCLDQNQASLSPPGGCRRSCAPAPPTKPALPPVPGRGRPAARGRSASAAARAASAPDSVASTQARGLRAFPIPTFQSGHKEQDPFRNSIPALQVAAWHKRGAWLQETAEELGSQAWPLGSGLAKEQGASQGGNSACVMGFGPLCLQSGAPYPARCLQGEAGLGRQG